MAAKRIRFSKYYLKIDFISRMVCHGVTHYSYHSRNWGRCNLLEKITIEKDADEGKMKRRLGEGKGSGRGERTRIMNDVNLSCLFNHKM